ncbi:LysR family transcriptional regulator [Corallococcus sp. AB049A]|uniref:LysR family transcriptional regulator n=1 Tax=Corallococcus interemptor TaxID=2316720 RepID=A0A3A8R0Y5_9BACT|nr:MULTISPECIES: LysR family transcriptional regulator [Corallococcus]RKH51714.1 LysR family transcriptional regulator [Corallococcus sp. AB050B]RKH70772.1 LysR family transcriptional regulator [Corallococcus interemptor]RKI71318.1 LysR family transcriptional regulator [Corallococcus sp. AB049A]
MEQVAPYFTFAEVVRTGSFTVAARSLGLSKATVSKQVMALEEALGVRLLQRTTRKLSPTAEGRALAARCQRMTQELEAAKAEVLLLRRKPRGPLRVSIPMSFGLLRVLPAMPEFLERYPEIELDIQLDDRVVDLVEQGFDACIRIAQLPDSSLLARKLASSRRVICATPAYLHRHGTPHRPEDLRQHRCLQYTYLASGAAWRLRGPGDVESLVETTGTLKANSSLALKTAVLGHAGIAQFPLFAVWEELRDGQLVEVLDDHTLPELSIWAVHAQGRTVTPKVGAWMDFLARRFADEPGWNLGAQAKRGA